MRRSRTLWQRWSDWRTYSLRMSQDYEGNVQTTETLIELAMIRLLVARLGG